MKSETRQGYALYTVLVINTVRRFSSNGLLCVGKDNFWLRGKIWHVLDTNAFKHDLGLRAIKNKM